MVQPLKQMTLILSLVCLTALNGCAMFGIFVGKTPVERLVDTLGTDHPAEVELIDRGSEAIEPLLQVLKTGDLLSRRRAAAIIARIAPNLPAGDTETVNKAVAALGGVMADGDPDVVIGALRGLGSLRAAGEVEAVGDVMLKNPDLAVKSTAAEVLGRIGTSSTHVLIKIAGDKANPVYCRVLAADAIPKVTSSGPAVAALIGILNETGSVPLRDAAIEALSAIVERAPLQMGAVVAQLANPDAGVRSSFAAVITRVGPCFFSWSDADQGGPDVYKRLMSDPYAPIRAMAVRSLVRTDVIVRDGDTLRRHALTEADLAVVRGRVVAFLSSESDPAVLSAAAWAAGRLGAEAAVERLVELLGNPDAGVRYGAITALQSLTGRRFDYQPLAPEAVRSEAISKWKQWCAAGRPE